MAQEYGVLLGRFSPIHLGHQAIIDEIIMDGRTPLIIIGGANKFDDRHPFYAHEREEMILSIYPKALVKISNDSDHWDEWFEELKLYIPNNAVIYTNNKEQDRIDFQLYGKEYKNTFYNDIWKDQGYQTKEVTFPYKRKLDCINATDIRNNIEDMKWALDPKTYKFIKGIERCISSTR